MNKFLLLLLIPVMCFSTIRYFDPTLGYDIANGKYSVANRDSSGSAGNAYNDMRSLNLIVDAGDTTWLRGGSGHIDTFLVGNPGSDAEGIAPSNSGVSQNSAISYFLYPGENLTFIGNTVTSCAIALYDVNYIKVSGLSGSYNLRFLYFDQGFLQIASNNTNNGEWDGTGGSNYNEISYCEFAYLRYLKLPDWEPNHEYAAGDTVIPWKDKNYRAYVASGSGTSGSTEPAWEASGGTSDGDISWDVFYYVDYRSSTIYRSSCYNWIHNCSFHDVGFYGTTYDGASLFEIGWDQCGAVGGNCLDSTNSNVIENCEFYHGGHHTLGVMHYHQVIRNNSFHNEQYFNRSGDGVWHAYRNFMITGSMGPYTSNHGFNLFENNRISHGSENVGAGNRGGDAFFIMQRNTIGRYNCVYATSGPAVSTPLHINTDVINTKFYNNTFFACGWGATFPSIASPPDWNTHNHRSIYIQPGWDGGSWPEHARMAFKNNLFWKNYGYNTSGDTSNNFNSNFGPDWNFKCGDTVCADMEFSANYNDSGSGTDPKFTNEGDYGSPHIDTTNVEWYWKSTPDGSDITTINTEPDFTLQGSSPAIDQGSYLTQANGAKTNKDTLIVDATQYFQDGWGNGAGGGAVVQADYIAIGTVSNTVQIEKIVDSITIILSSSKTWDDNANVWLYKKSDGEIVLYGTAPDAGAKELNASPKKTYMKIRR
jgi:hypothetical protein